MAFQLPQSSATAQDLEDYFEQSLHLPDMSRPRSRSPASAARIRVKNRRKRYLDTHLAYLASPALELAGLPHRKLTVYIHH